ncbi:galactitol-1-phosphate 5-dehydrogenase [Salibacterium qingdaonense]|uniref:L-iditol 2-dehydrogenase n=1 Tax=Salibacterium qingdaonense TaxID=266892 RepID=A0A1I4PJ32_9BACI|nr:galactitol-1-phosphate 5-dehydrogenase [Salibacterium qingdaonense]SFM27851.1 L-iditol 2-dehydrogenase [Salibacterium qingdaonense]
MMMKALTLHGKKDLRMEDVPLPEVTAPDDVVIQVAAAGICGSDLSRYAKLGPYVKGMTFGHEFAGTVLAVGTGVTHVKPGDRVAGCPAFPCGTCRECEKGNPARCQALTVLGAFRPGAFAEQTKLPAANVVPVPEGVTMDAAALMEPSAVALHALYRSALEPGAATAVLGCGNIGLLSIQWAKQFGADNVYAIDIDPSKLERAARLGADVCLNPKEQNVEEALLAYNGEGVDAAVESAGSPVTSVQVLALPKKGGDVIYMGIPYNDITFERYYFERIVRNELRVLGGWNAVSAPFPGREWSATAAALADGTLEMEPVISHRLPLEEGPAVFENIINQEEPFSKVILHPDG